MMKEEIAREMKEVENCKKGIKEENKEERKEEEKKTCSNSGKNNYSIRRNNVLDNPFNRGRKNVKFTSTPNKRVSSNSTQKSSSTQSVIFNGIAAMCAKLVYRFSSIAKHLLIDNESSSASITSRLRFTVTETCST